VSLDEEANNKMLKSFAVWDYPLTDLFTRLYNAMQSSGWVKSAEAGIERILQSSENTPFGMIIDYAQGKYIESGKCELNMIGKILARRSFAFGFSKGSLYRAKFNEM
jgi:hypothetical protein